MAAVVFDIETSGISPEVFDRAQIDYLMKGAEKEENEERRQKVKDELIKQLNLWPMTAQVVAIALLNVESGNGISLYVADEESETEKKVADPAGTDGEKILHLYKRGREENTREILGIYNTI